MKNEEQEEIPKYVFVTDDASSKTLQKLIEIKCLNSSNLSGSKPFLMMAKVFRNNPKHFEIVLMKHSNEVNP
jgi:hypothetical protein